MSFFGYRQDHGGCWMCYGKGRSYKHDHKTCKVYEEDKQTYFQAHPQKVPKEKQIDEWKRRQAGGGPNIRSSDNGDRRIPQIDEVADLLRKAWEDLKRLQGRMGGQGRGDSEQHGAAVN